MSEVNTAPAVETSTAVAAPVKAAAKKAATKKPVKKAATKAATKNAAKTAPAKKAAKTAKATDKAPRAKKEGLRKPQIRILKLLAKKDGLNRNEISQKAPVDVATCVEYIGSHDEATRLANDAKHFPCLITLGLVKAQKHDVEGKDVVQYFITAKGKAEAAKN